MLNTYDHKFELRGRQIFVPSRSGRRQGVLIKRWVKRRWSSPLYFFHFRNGGHVSAAKVHIHNSVFARLDLCSFFDSITRTKVHRALRSIGFDPSSAYEFACESTVEKTLGKRDFSLPFGFVQSPLLASVALDRSALGNEIGKLARSNTVTVSVYMDDIILSGHDLDRVDQAQNALIKAAHQARFCVNVDKTQKPGPTAVVFNLLLSQASTLVTVERLSRFEQQILLADRARRNGIVSYVESVSPVQAAALKAVLPP
jgi:reverse transcriptase-like protein